MNKSVASVFTAENMFDIQGKSFRCLLLCLYFKHLSNLFGGFWRYLMRGLIWHL